MFVPDIYLSKCVCMQAGIKIDNGTGDEYTSENGYRNWQNHTGMDWQNTGKDRQTHVGKERQNHTGMDRNKRRAMDINRNRVW